MKQKISETVVTETLLIQPTTEVTTGSSDVAIMRAVEPASSTTESSSDTGTWLAPTHNYISSTIATTTSTTTTTTTTTRSRRFRRRCRRFFRWRNGKCVSIRRRTSTPQHTSKPTTTTATTTTNTTTRNY